MSERQMYWFTADHHFGHENIIKYCNRPFETVEEMDRELIARWNEVVRPYDLVYHLGDFTLGDTETAIRYFHQLNGAIYIIGDEYHHDRRWLHWTREGELWTKTGGIVHIIPPIYKTKFLVTFVLSHFPMREWHEKHYGAVHLHGHSHGRTDWIPFKDKAMDVGVDTNNFYPYSLEKIYQIMEIEYEHE